MDPKSMIKDVISYIMLKEPLIGLMLKRTWIIARRDRRLASTDGLYIYVNPDEFFKLKPARQAYILAHEVLHMVLQHPSRIPHALERILGRKPVVPRDELEAFIIEKLLKLLNIIADAVVNTQLDRSQIGADDDAVRCYHLEVHLKIPTDVCEKESFENIVELLMRGVKGKDGAGDFPIPGDMVAEGDVFPEDGNNEGEGGGGSDESGGSSGGAGGGDVLNEGDSDERNLRSLPDAPERIREKVTRKFLESYMVAKSIGRLPAFAERVINEILTPRLDWRQLLRRHLIGSNVKRTWSRPSRKHPDFPGKELRKRARTVVLVDTSGSIGEAELRRFVAEIYGMLRERSEVIVVPWDAVAYPEIKLERPSDIVKLKLTGGGGTLLLPALRVLDAKYGNYDNVVILSDWHIGDLDSAEVQSILKKYRNKILAVTTSAQPPRFLRSIKVDL